MNKKFKLFLLEIFGRLCEFLRFSKIAKNFLPDDFSVRVLCFHDIPEKDLTNFEKQIIFLKKEYKIITPQELRDFFSGRGFLPGKNIFITFDDGSTDQYKAAEILDRHSIKAGFFVCVGDTEKGETITSRPNSRLKAMSWEQVEELSKRGHIIGSHTMTHPNLAKLQPVEIFGELSESKKILEQKTGTTVDFFAFPFGTAKEISDEAVLIASNVYDYNFYFLAGKDRFDEANRFFIKRNGVSPNYSTYQLRAIVTGVKDFIYRKQLKKLSRFLGG